MTATGTIETAVTDPSPLQNIKRTIIAADKVAAEAEAIAGIAELCNDEGVPFTASFPAGQFPADHNLAIYPIRQKADIGKGSSVVEIIALALPTLDNLLNHATLGKQARGFVEDCVNAVLLRKGVAASQKDDAILPQTVADFIITKRGGGGIMAGFNDIAGYFVKFLKGRNFPDTFDKNMLRQCLSNAAAADQWFGHFVTQDTWRAILGKMAEFAEAKGLPTDIYHEWAAQRDEAEFVIDTINLDSALGALAPPAQTVPSAQQ